MIFRAAGARRPPRSFIPLNVRSILPTALLLLLASNAAAAVWQVSDARTLAAALSGSAAGDEIVLARAAKPYAGPIALKESQKLTGAPGDPAPVITADDGVVITAASGTTIRHVDVAGNAKTVGIRITGGNVTIDKCGFRDNAASIDVAAGEKSEVVLTLTSNRFQHNAAALAVTASGKARVRLSMSKNNVAGTTVSAISLFSRDNAELTATIAQNELSGAVCGGACNAIRLTANDSSSFSAAIRDNVINGSDESAIRAVAAAGSPSMALAIEGNTVNAPATAGPAIHVTSGATKNDTARVCAKIARNRLGGTHIRLLRSAPGATLALDPQRRFGTTAAAEAAVAAANGGAVVRAAVRNGATPEFGAANCRFPE